MLWHADRPLATLPLPWARAHNVRNADVYVRPARGYRWPLVFLDDVPCSAAAAVARKYGALLIHTSAAGGCHIWLRCSLPLDEDERHRAQRYLAPRLGADLGSISGEHLGRLAGFKNCKRAGVWVNVLQASELAPWQPAPALAQPPSPAGQRRLYGSPPRVSSRRRARYGHQRLGRGLGLHLQPARGRLRPVPRPRSPRPACPRTTRHRCRTLRPPHSPQGAQPARPPHDRPGSQQRNLTPPKGPGHAHPSGGENAVVALRAPPLPGSATASNPDRATPSGSACPS